MTLTSARRVPGRRGDHRQPMRWRSCIAPGERLLHSERPPKLKGDELEEYNSLLEEQVFPFEEQAIKATRSIRRTQNGIAMNGA